jgi:glycosyltransferase involved in cell wall biosynthesis
MPQTKVSVIVHHNKNNDVTFPDTLQSIYNQTYYNIEVLILNDPEIKLSEKSIAGINKNHIPTRIITESNDTLGGYLNSVLYSISSAYVLYIYNLNTVVLLKQSAVDLFLLACEHNDNTGMVYADYELHENNKIKEIHLLKHHIGRVRDNQVYGCVFLFNHDALEACGWADESLKFNTLYDLRLKLSEKYKLIHIANRYAGSLYKIGAESKAHNVFDYLLAGRESQIEAENVLTEHLKRINAYLKPGFNYYYRSETDVENELIASIIIPVYNRPDFIRTAIESVQAQTVQQIEVIVVVNGGPDDPTANEVRRYMPGGDKYNADKPTVQLLVHDINNLGLCLNLGAKTARGKYYVQLDSDDRLKPEAVEKILKVYNSDPRIGMVIGSYEVWQKDDKGIYSRMEELPVVTHDEWTEENGRNNLLRINGAGAPRSLPIALIRQIGFSVNDEPYARNYGEDYNMVLKVSERYRIGRVWDAIYEVVRHSGGTDHSIDQQTIDRNDEAKDYMRAQAIQRRIELNNK